MGPAPESSEFVHRTWVQCENESCLKWRLLSPAAAAAVNPSEPWYCFMNTDPSYSSCSVSEEDFPEESQFLENGYKFVYSQLPLGSLVLVKLRNWPSWPGILCPDPFKGKYVTYDQDGNVEKYYVEFLGDPHSTAWMSAAFVGHFSLTLEAADCTKKKRWYRSALEEAYQLYRCSAEQRLEVCCLSKPNRAKTDTKAAVVTKKGMQVSKINTEKKRPRVRKRKRDAALKCSVEIFCSDEALSKENMDVTWIHYTDDFMLPGPCEPKAATVSICVSEGETKTPQGFQSFLKARGYIAIRKEWNLPNSTPDDIPDLSAERGVTNGPLEEQSVPLTADPSVQPCSFPAPVPASTSSSATECDLRILR